MTQLSLNIIINSNFVNKTENYGMSADIKQIGKRLETVDGVEIASSYKEYLDLALGDLEDRLKKSNIKSDDFQDRIHKRTNLLNDIESEIEKRKAYSNELMEKDKLLRTRLIRNTEMKSALQNLADIAGYKLNSMEKLSIYSGNENGTLINLDENTRNLTSLLGERLAESNNTTYTRYIEMAYVEVDTMLANDKQTLVDVIRKLKTNEAKLKELEQLRVKVNSSLKILNEYEGKLVSMISHDNQIAKTVKQLEEEIKRNLSSTKSNELK